MYPRSVQASDEQRSCADCAAEPGDLHDLGCEFERCPFCRGALQTCMCRYERLGLLDERHGAQTDYLPETVYEDGLDEEQEAQWLAILEAKGRVPYAPPPATLEWEGTGPGPLASLVDLLTTCSERGDFDGLSRVLLVSVGHHGHLVARAWEGYLGRHPITGTGVVVPARFSIGFELRAPDGSAAAERYGAHALVETAEACRIRLDRGEDDVEWTDIGILHYWQKWAGLTRLRLLRLEPFWATRDSVSELSVPHLLRG